MQRIPSPAQRTVLSRRYNEESAANQDGETLLKLIVTSQGLQHVSVTSHGRRFIGAPAVSVVRSPSPRLQTRSTNGNGMSASIVNMHN